jgi:hypothetical protein
MRAWRLGVRLAGALLLHSLAVAPMASGESPPPKNPYLADSVYALGHGDSAQQDSMAIAGPTGSTRILAPEDIDYAPLGPAHFGAYISGPYPDGRRVIWSNGREALDWDTG